MSLTERLSKILSLNLGKEYTSVSYAIMKDGKIWAADALGTEGKATDPKDNIPATINHTYNVCSISKVFCTVAVMKLVEQGKVELDTPVVNYLPDFTMLDPRYRDITVRHCLNHSSGLPGTQWKHFSATKVGSLDNEEYYQEVYEYLAKCYLKADPGRYSAYCNDGFTLAEMVVAKVSGMPFGEFCKQYITEPIGAHSTRTAMTRNTDYPLMRDGKKPAELLYIQGCGGFTTTMIDLCKFGQLFLEENEIISEESKAEMRKLQGATDIPTDTRSKFFGLGWDNADLKDPEYELGDHVQMKSGNSFQFTSMFYVIPKYNAVLAISETHDCHLDVGSTILKMFATAMWEEEGINIYKKYQPVPKELVEKFDGTYIFPSATLRTHFFGSNLTLLKEDLRGNKDAWYKDLKYNGKTFVDNENNPMFFEEHNGQTFFFTTFQERVSIQAMKAENHPVLSETWKQRIGKRYVAIDIPADDLVGNEIMTAFELASLKEVEGIVLASFSGISGGDVYGQFEGCFVPVDDNRGQGILPCNRDLVCPNFEQIDGIEHCWVSSYLYRDESTLPVYEGQTFESTLYNGEKNSVYKLNGELKELPAVPEGKRLLVLNENMSVVYDSVMNQEYSPVKEGYLSFLVK